MTNPADGTAAAILILETGRRSEKRQALTYRAMAARAEDARLPELAQRFHDLHADEQHHLSRLTARILELRGQPADFVDVGAVALPLEGWEDEVRSMEDAEILLYERVLQADIDSTTRALIESIVQVELSHLSELGGKWTMA